MNIIKSRMQKDLNAEITFGYITADIRYKLKIEKTHFNDAFIIAGGTEQVRSIRYMVIQKRKNNRKLQLNRKGFKPSIRRQRYKLQPKDLIKIKGEVCEVVGTHNKGKNVMIKNRDNKKVSIPIKKVEWYFNNKTLIFKKGEEAILSL